MHEENTAERLPSTSRFKNLIESTDALTLSKILDINTEPASGDTILTDAMINQYSDEAFSAAIERWSAFSIGLDETDPKDRAYLAIAHSRIDRLHLGRMLYQQVLGEVDQSEGIRELEALVFEHYNPALYHAALKQRIQLLEDIPIDNPELLTARANLLDELDSFVKDSPETLELPEPETIIAVNNWLRNEYGDSLAVIETFEGDTVDASHLNDAFNHAMQQTPALRETGWTSVVVERKKTAVSTMVSRKQTWIPSQRVAKKEVAGALVVHEVLGHALRSANAELLGNEIGAIGTATYPTFEESFEIALEQCFKGKYDPERGLNHYIASGLAVTDFQSPQKINQLFTSIKQLEYSVNGMTPETVTKADNVAAVLFSRTFAGMTDVDNGIAHLQDINYLHGLDGAWRLLNHLVRCDDLDAGMRWLQSAKFNPFDRTDREVVNLYTPMPPSLYTIFDMEEKKVL